MARLPLAHFRYVVSSMGTACLDDVLELPMYVVTSILRVVDTADLGS